MTLVQTLEQGKEKEEKMRNNTSVHTEKEHHHSDETDLSVQEKDSGQLSSTCLRRGG